MNKNVFVWLKEARVYVLPLLVVLVVNALVPALSRLGTTEGVLSFWQMAFWVNVFALITLIPLKLLNQKKKKRKHDPFGIKDILKVSGFALIWPFIFSFLYFGSVEIGSATLTTIVSRLSIFVYLFMQIFFYKEKNKFDWKDLGLMLCMIMAVTLAFTDDLSRFSWKGLLLPLVMVIGVAVTSGIYQSVSEKWRTSYDSLETILWLEVAMVVYSTLLFWLLDYPFLPTGVGEEGIMAMAGALWKPLVIGVAANAFGFWARLHGQQTAADLPDHSHVIVFLVITTGVVTFIQIVVISMITSEVVTVYQWIAGVLLVAGLIVHRLLKSRIVVESD